MNSIGFPELLILLMMFLLLAVPIWAVVDAALRPGNHWAAAGQSKTLWLALLTAGALLPVIGFILLIVYLASIRPQLKRAAG
jgi:hypothetical protein